MTALARRLPTIVLSAAAAASLLLLTGCDNEPALRDRALARQIADQRAAAAGLMPDQVDAARTRLDKIFADAENHATKSQAKAMSAHLSFQSAQATLILLEQQRARVDLLLSDLTRLAIRLQGVADDTAAALALNPQPVLASIGDQLVPQARGDGNRELWLPFDKGMGGLPTLSGAQQRRSALESEIARKREQVEQLARQRDSLVEQSDEAMRQSESEKGQASVDAFRRGADLRQQADNVSARMLLLEAELIPLQASLALITEQEEKVKSAIAVLEARKADVDASWSLTRQLLMSLDQSGLGLVAGGDAGAFTVEGRLVELNAALEEAARLRDDALAALKRASDDFNSAAAAADALRRDPAMANLDSAALEMPAWRALTDYAVSGASYRLHEAIALQASANLQLAEAAQTALRARVREALAVVAPKLPEQSRARLNTVMSGMPASVAEERSSAIAAAEAAYKQADDVLAGIIDGRVPVKTVQDAAKVLRVLSLYGLAQVEQVKASVGVPAETQAKMQAAIAFARQVRDDGVNLPSLPPALAAALQDAPRETTPPPGEN